MVERRRAGGYGRRTRGREEDVFSSWRHIYCYTQRAGVCAEVKRGARRRERREAKVAIRAAMAGR